MNARVLMCDSGHLVGASRRIVAKTGSEGRQKTVFTFVKNSNNEAGGKAPLIPKSHVEVPLPNPGEPQVC